MLLKLSIMASRRGWPALSAFLLELDCALAGLGGASHRIRREQDHRRRQPRANFMVLL